MKKVIEMLMKSSVFGMFLGMPLPGGKNILDRTELLGMRKRKAGRGSKRGRRRRKGDTLRVTTWRGI